MNENIWLNKTKNKTIVRFGYKCFSFCVMNIYELSERLYLKQTIRVYMWHLIKNNMISFKVLPIKKSKEIQSVWEISQNLNTGKKTVKDTQKKIILLSIKWNSFSILNLPIKNLIGPNSATNECRQTKKWK